MGDETGKAVCKVSNGMELLEKGKEINQTSEGVYTIYLLDDIVLPESLCFYRNTITIFGCGHTIYGEKHSLLKVKEKAVLNLGERASVNELVLSAEGQSMADPLIEVNGLDARMNLYPGICLQNNRDAQRGAAGIQIGDGAVVAMYGGEIRNCASRYMAGAVLVDLGTFYMMGGRIHDCSGENGGAVLVQNHGRLVMSGNSTIERCSAVQYGGGIYGESGSLCILGGTIQENHACYGGGVAAAYIKSGWRKEYGIELKNTKIIRNEAIRGGGILLYDSTITSPVSECLIADNKARADADIALIKNSRIEMDEE